MPVARKGCLAMVHEIYPLMARAKRLRWDRSRARGLPPFFPPAHVRMARLPQPRLDPASHAHGSIPSSSWPSVSLTAREIAGEMQKTRKQEKSGRERGKRAQVPSHHGVTRGFRGYRHMRLLNRRQRRLVSLRRSGPPLVQPAPCSVSAAHHHKASASD